MNLLLKSTIFALATPPGKSGVCVVRISGPHTATAITGLTNNPLPTPRTAVLRKFYNPADQTMIDSGLLLWFQAPHSFTGEDSAELHLHGSVAVINATIAALGNIPCLRLAEPGEFSRRAFNNGKMDLTQAEGLADLIDSETTMQHRQALRQSSGELGQLYEGWRAQLLQVLGFMEAYIDFPDEDLPDWLLKEVTRNQQYLLATIQDYLADSHRGERLRAGLYVAIIGAPNAGKSSLINFLARRDVAIVSHQAGTTRDVLEVHLDIGGYPLTLADTAGLRVAKEDVEQEGIKRSHKTAARADLVIALFDASLLPNLDAETMALLDENTMIVFNKTDLMSGQLQIPPALAAYQSVAISLANRTGITELLAELEQRAASMLSPAAFPAITRERYRTLLQECATHLARCDITNDIVLAAEDLRLAARALAAITGTLGAEDVLDYIFANFCIGK